MRTIDNLPRDERGRGLIADAAEMSDDVSEDSPLVGYIVLAFYGDGTTRTAGHSPTVDAHKIGWTMFNAWARETLDHHLAYKVGVNATYDVLNGES